MDDNTTSLKRDPSQVTLMVAGSKRLAEDMLTHYGIKTMLGTSIILVRNSADAMAAIANYPNTTPWCLVADGLTDTQIRKMMTAYFGLVQSIPRALGVVNAGKLMRFGG